MIIVGKRMSWRIFTEIDDISVATRIRFDLVSSLRTFSERTLSGSGQSQYLEDG